ncbi:hypothetical protein Dimus_008041 [Dionaea muscipula]
MFGMRRLQMKDKTIRRILIGKRVSDEVEIREEVEKEEVEIRGNPGQIISFMMLRLKLRNLRYGCASSEVVAPARAIPSISDFTADSSNVRPKRNAARVDRSVLVGGILDTDFLVASGT